MSDGIVLRNGLVFDPANGINGEKMDLCISDGRIVEKEGAGAKSIDLKGRIVLPGGVDLHSHIVGSKMSLARAISPDYHRLDPVPRTKSTRSGVGYTVPSSYVIGYRYSSMGYTTVIEPAMQALKALACWEELSNLSNLNTGLMPMFGNSMLTFHYVRDDDLNGLAGYLAWVLRAVGGFGVKAVNPGGTYAWAHRRNIRTLDMEVPDWEITPREITRMLCKAVELLGLPHTLHLHPNNLGCVGNIETTLVQLEALRDIRGHAGRKQIVHLPHMSFESLGMVDNGSPVWNDVQSGGCQLAEYYNKNEHFTVDLGQITMGPAMTMTADGPFQFSLYKMTRGKWASSTVDVELPGGGGIVPYEYRPSSPANSVQWAIALEFALSIDDLWRCAISTDSPNGGPFSKYPLVISWLMSKKQREAWIRRLHPLVLERSIISELDREWDLYEVAITTRAAPARILGFSMKGHLGIGADADIAILDSKTEDTDLSKKPNRIIRLFERTYQTYLGGQKVAQKGKVLTTPYGHVSTIHPVLDESDWNRMEKELEPLMNSWYSHSFCNYSVPERYRLPFERKSILDATAISL
ncbi:MAG: formylmethanofuran dehydrogenase subunit A [Candidatus Thorarchaeota archaeon]|nr:formylmethanofuran dehydrogenase subunit A [Candidatus Thorarchaeota archaeon]